MTEANKDHRGRVDGSEWGHDVECRIGLEARGMQSEARKTQW